MKIRIKFRKYGALKFIGHLDVMRYFQKAIRRAGIDIKYSEGFNPHMIMSFAAPLGVGITSDGEYFDIQVQSTLSSRDSLKALNDTMVEGIDVVSYVALPESAGKAMSSVAAADYEVFYKEHYEIPCSSEEFANIIKRFYQEQEHITVLKKTKKSETEIDLKPLIYNFQVKEREGKPCFYLMLSTGSVDNIKPEFVLQTMYEYAHMEYQTSAMQIHKLETYLKQESGEFAPLDAVGEEIV